MTEPIFTSLPLWILLLPLFGFLLNGLAYPLAAKGMRHTHAGISGAIASSVMLGSFVLSCIAFVQLRDTASPLMTVPFQWLAVPGMEMSVSLRIDQLSSIMTLIITGVGSLIHIYSIGYMAEEEGVARFFAYLNLFCFAMLLLVLSDNLLFLFFGWEGVGLCSYLLISYWYKETPNGDAARKAFLVNRVGDVGFVLAMAILFMLYKTLNFNLLAQGIAPDWWLGAAAALLFFAATGKSAQLPLYVWLPDAMAGPTPVSALIHAATMVTAGVYLFVRMHFVFDLYPSLMHIVAWVGVLTALLGGTISLVQTDIKRLLAYSTVSQLGFMFLAVGVGAYHAAVFHLMTHAFFKALLFLGAGSVIHACGGEQDMRKMGGLSRAIPLTYGLMLVGSAAIVGLPFFSGFFSKDAIIYEALILKGGSTPLFILALLAAFLTAIYSVRLLLMTFWGQPRSGIHAHESPPIMTFPLVVLAVLAALGGFLGVPSEFGHLFGWEHSHLLSSWLEPVVSAVHGETHAAVPEWAISLLTVALSITGLFVGKSLFQKNFQLPMAGLSRLFEAKYYVDELYGLLLVRPLHRAGRWLARALEARVFLSFGNWMGGGSIWSGDRLKAIQNGDIQFFTLALTAGVVALVCFLLLWTRV